MNGGGRNSWPIARQTRDHQPICHWALGSITRTILDTSIVPNRRRAPTVQAHRHVATNPSHVGAQLLKGHAHRKPTLAAVYFTEEKMRFVPTQHGTGMLLEH